MHMEVVGVPLPTKRGFSLLQGTSSASLSWSSGLTAGVLLAALACSVALIGAPLPDPLNYSSRLGSSKHRKGLSVRLLC